MPMLVHAPMSEILKWNDCRTDLIGGAATQPFASGGKHPRATTDIELAFATSDCISLETKFHEMQQNINGVMLTA